VPAASEPAVEVVDLRVGYGRGAHRTEAVDGLGLTAARGAVTAVLGPNGAGKTTTVETCEGLRRATAGTVRVLGLDPATSSAELRPRVGVMLQDGGVAGGARAGEVLAYAARMYARPLDPAGLAARLGIDTAGRTPFRRLSGGEQQRVKLALAVIGRPDLVFLDEPSAGLDPQARHATWDLVRDLRTAGVSVVLTTHLMDEAEELADHVVIMDHGRAVAAGSPAELMAAGAGDALRFQARGGLDLVALVGSLPAGSSAVEEAPGSYRVDGEVGPALLAGVTAWCATQGVMPEGLTAGRRSLEAVFLDLTGRALR
jgi:ABC-2 type transport system ATP-binding protein